MLGWFGGQEFGAAVADVLIGATEPGGRLTTTWPAALEDVPVLDVVPVDGVLRYDEGIHVGYRAWLVSGREPAYPFGWGLGFTTWSLNALTVDGALESDDLTLRFELRNTGDRAGKFVAQVYAERPDSLVDRPVRWLVGTTARYVEAGESTEAVVAVRSRSLEHWVGGRDGQWMLEPGSFRLRVGSSVIDLALSTDVTVSGADTSA